MLGKELTRLHGERRATVTTDAAGRRCSSRPSISAPACACATSSLDGPRGEIVGLAGLLGSGRTETARPSSAPTARRRQRSEIDGAGRQLSREPADAIARGIGFFSEDRKVEGIVPDMSVRENLTLALLPRLRKARHRRRAPRSSEIVDRFIKALGIKCASPEQRIRELSGGNQQKVLLARWLCMNPKLLILDEPTRGIDVGAKAEIQTLIRGLADEGLGVLMISSELEEMIEGADRVFVLRDGRTVAASSPQASSAKTG